MKKELEEKYAKPLINISSVSQIEAPKRLRKSTLADQIEMLEFEITSLRWNFTVRSGPAIGTIEDRDVVWEIRCMEATLDTLKGCSAKAAQ